MADDKSFLTAALFEMFIIDLAFLLFSYFDDISNGDDDVFVEGAYEFLSKNSGFLIGDLTLKEFKEVFSQDVVESALNKFVEIFRLEDLLKEHRHSERMRKVCDEISAERILHGKSNKLGADEK